MLGDNAQGIQLSQGFDTRMQVVSTESVSPFGPDGAINLLATTPPEEALSLGLTDAA